MSEPNLCRPEAFRAFAREMPEVNSVDGLVRAAAAISMHELEGVQPEAVLHKLDALADRVRSRVKGGQTLALLAHLHDVLFEEEGFVGNVNDYYNPLNSYLPAVLRTRRGIPITLVLVYKAVGSRLGLEIEGINAPGHFLARVDTFEGALLVDPFFSGRMLNEDEAFRRIEEMTGRRLPHRPGYLRPATHRRWLARMLANLHNIFAEAARREDLAAMTELGTLLEGKGEG